MEKTKAAIKSCSEKYLFLQSTNVFKIPAPTYPD